MKDYEAQGISQERIDTLNILLKRYRKYLGAQSKKDLDKLITSNKTTLAEYYESSPYIRE